MNVPGGRAWLGDPGYLAPCSSGTQKLGPPNPGVQDRCPLPQLLGPRIQASGFTSSVIFDSVAECGNGHREVDIHGNYQEEGIPINGHVYELLLCAKTHAGGCRHSRKKDKLLALVSGGALPLLKSCL